jgi:hypothetical protein
MAKDEDEKQIKRLLESVNPEKNYYILHLKKELELIDIVRRSRVLCESQK